MELKQIKNVMEKYRKAWEEQDSQIILECFTKNGVYQESPLAKPYRGHKEIKKFWDRVVVDNTKNIKFKPLKYYITDDKKTGFVEWECKNFHKRKDKWRKDHMVGIMILKMKGNRISFLNEYWNTKSV